jgi:hypothetical protein
MSVADESNNPDLKTGVPDQALAGEMLVGHVDEDQVLLARRGGEVFAIGATCTHYGGQLGEGLIVGDSASAPRLRAMEPGARDYVGRKSVYLPN